MTPNEIAELGIQESIQKHIDDFHSFRFNAGAGAGKTYALIETLKYVTINKIAATKSPQKVACITYTNVAVNEIKTRLGNSEAVQVSTIHERIWELIKRAQPQLLICHKEKIEESIKENNQELINSDKTKFFNNLTQQQQHEFTNFAIRTKDLFYQSKNLSANLFEKAYIDHSEGSEPDFILKCLPRNVGNFKKTVGLIYKDKRLKDCLNRIETRKEKRVNYDSKANSDRLHYMKFSHNTLLEYGLKLVETYPTLCRIIIDNYPYFFIDEYQDTNSNVVKFIKTINDYAIENKKDWLVGYFGDTAQNIYEDGVGVKITDFHQGLININKIFNRRSHQQIIDVANKIRSDEIVQKPVFKDRRNGSVSFYHSTSKDKIITTQKFLAEYKKDIIIDNGVASIIRGEKSKIHCLVLTNKLLASFNEFEDVYDVYTKSTIYHEELKTQVLSHQLEKLHPTVLTIYHLVKFYLDIQEGKVSYYDIFGIASKNLTFSKSNLLIQELRNKEIILLKDLINFIAERLKNSNAKDALAKALINRIHFNKDEVVSSEKFSSKLLDSINLLMNENSVDESKAKQKVNKVLALPIKSLKSWVKFIDRIEESDVIYHTYHGTKGEEYENVAVILEHSFGSKEKDKFKKYFDIVQKGDVDRKRLLTDPVHEYGHNNTKNLLYVACSRAVKNLRILYLDDISEIKDGIKAIFGESKLWPTD